MANGLYSDLIHNDSGKQDMWEALPSTTQIQINNLYDTHPDAKHAEAIADGLVREYYDLMPKKPTGFLGKLRENTVAKILSIATLAGFAGYVGAKIGTGTSSDQVSDIIKTQATLLDHYDQLKQSPDITKYAKTQNEIDNKQTKLIKNLEAMLNQNAEADKAIVVKVAELEQRALANIERTLAPIHAVGSEDQTSPSPTPITSYSGNCQTECGVVIDLLQYRMDQAGKKTHVGYRNNLDQLIRSTKAENRQASRLNRQDIVNSTNGYLVELYTEKRDYAQAIKCINDMTGYKPHTKKTTRVENPDWVKNRAKIDSIPDLPDTSDHIEVEKKDKLKEVKIIKVPEAKPREYKQKPLKTGYYIDPQNYIYKVLFEKRKTVDGAEIETYDIDRRGYVDEEGYVGGVPFFSRPRIDYEPGLNELSPVRIERETSEDGSELRKVRLPNGPIPHYNDEVGLLDQSQRVPGVVLGQYVKNRWNNFKSKYLA
ncbi:MAG TPA: hypothetical protein VJB89_03600 [Candidatus Nanoarchaeia archaeon]|nr:hypothetical protein [Candidatus Nanoarchaeia archaeon]